MPTINLTHFFQVRTQSDEHNCALFIVLFAIQYALTRNGRPILQAEADRFRQRLLRTNGMHRLYIRERLL